MELRISSAAQPLVGTAFRAHSERRCRKGRHTPVPAFAHQSQCIAGVVTRTFQRCFGIYARRGGGTHSSGNTLATHNR